MHAVRNPKVFLTSLGPGSLHNERIWKWIIWDLPTIKWVTLGHNTVHGSILDLTHRSRDKVPSGQHSTRTMIDSELGLSVKLRVLFLRICKIICVYGFKFLSFEEHYYLAITTKNTSM